MTAWLSRRLGDDCVAKLQSLGEQDLYCDDSKWLDLLQNHTEESLVILVADLMDDIRLAKIRTYHGCRVLDAGVYHREGLKRNDPSKLKSAVRQMVSTEAEFAPLRPHLEKRLAVFDAADDHEGTTRDEGRVHVGFDDQELLDHCGAYALYGSEWVCALLGPLGHGPLRHRGVPTILQIDLPASWLSAEEIEGVCRDMLQEWIHHAANRRDWTPWLATSFILRRDIPPKMVTSHYHPEVINDPLYRLTPRKSGAVVCPHCAPNS